MLIRDAVAADFHKLHPLMQGLRIVEDAEVIPLEADVAWCLSLPPGAIVVAQDYDGMIVGMVTCWIHGGMAFIANLYVDEEYRGQGVAVKMIARIAEYVDRSAASIVKMTTRAADSGSEYGKRFYTEIGLTPEIMVYSGEAKAIIASVRQLGEKHG